MTDINVSLWYNYPERAFKDAPELGMEPHAQEAMRHLGITYKEATSHPIADCWIFYDCENIPDVLPKWARRIEK